ncbi:RNA-directed DNA polymerase, eukaryota, reverse transcriptase zinc-binding domain protein [Tanacetum coccineum]
MKNFKSVQLDECDLIRVEDASTMVMVKVKEIDTISNMYHVCRNEGFDDIKIHHIESKDSDDEDISSNGNVDPIEALVDFIQHVVEEKELRKHPLRTPKLMTLNLLDLRKVNHIVVHKDIATNEVVSDNSNPPGFKNSIKENKAYSQSSSTSRASKSSTSFANYIRKYLKGFSFINEMNRMIKVGDALGCDIKGCKKSLSRLINGIDHVERVILFGDLNEVREMRREEVMALLFLVGDATIFNSFIHDTGLIDLPMGGRHFTWVNKFGSKMRKLDRFLISDDVLYSNTNLKCVETAQQILVTVSKRSRDDAESFVTASE